MDKSQEDKRDLNALDENGRNEAFFSSQRDPSGEELSEFLRQGGDPDVVDNRGDTALHWATYNRKTTCALILLGASRCHLVHNLPKGETPLHHIISRTEEASDMVRLVKEYEHLAEQVPGAVDLQGRSIYHHLANRILSRNLRGWGSVVEEVSNLFGHEGWFTPDLKGVIPVEMGGVAGDGLRKLVAVIQSNHLEKSTSEAPARKASRRL